MSTNSDMVIRDNVRSTQPLDELYKRCNVALSDLTQVEKAFKKNE